MSKLKIGVLVAVIAVIATTSYIYISSLNKEKEKPVSVNKDALSFKKEYETLNGTYDEQRKRDYLNVTIDKDNVVKYATYEEIMKILDTSGVIYFGFPECPWCRNAVTVLMESAKDVDLDQIYYFNNLLTRDEKHLDENGTIVVDSEGTEEYRKLMAKMYDSLEVYEGLNDDTVKRLYFPTVVFVKDGKIVKLHTATVDSQTDSKIALNQEQYSELKKIYTDNMHIVLDDICDDKC